LPGCWRTKPSLAGEAARTRSRARNSSNPIATNSTVLHAGNSSNGTSPATASNTKRPVMAIRAPSLLASSASQAESTRHRNGREDAAQDVVNVDSIHLGLRTQAYTVPEARQGQRFDVVRRHEGPPGQPGPCLRRVQE